MNTLSDNNPQLVNLATNTSHALLDVTIIGRHEDCNLVLRSEKGASRKHARIIVENNIAVLMDLGSLNGTLVNGREIGRAVQLVDGDLIIFDQQTYRFVAGKTTNVDPSENITVVANKNEINHPDNIKPAIRVLDDDKQYGDTHDRIQQLENQAVSDLRHPSSSTISPNDTHSNQYDALDETEATDIPPPPSHYEADSLAPHYDEPIPATSRPGGDVPVRRRRENNVEHTYANGASRGWFKWVIIVPLILIAIVVASYFAYQFGISKSSGGG